MSQLTEPYLIEMEQEAAATRRVLQVVPGDKLDWRPHEKSLTLGQLAHHVATIPGKMSKLLAQDVFDVGDASEGPETARSTDELLPDLEGSLAQAKETLGGMDDARANGMWKLTAGDSTLMEAPRIGLYRSLVLNHWYHHRGQLCVYLRLLDIPVPSVYGSTADDNPFADAMAAAGGGQSA
jgi:uncharacterized damage-inducible protein DinB